VQLDRSGEKRIESSNAQTLQQIKRYENKVKRIDIAHYYKDKVPFEFKSQICMNSQMTHDILKRKGSKDLQNEDHSDNTSIYF
jgi:hypothetical protein